MSLNSLVSVPGRACRSGGQFSVTAAYSFAPARDISVFDHTQVLFAAHRIFPVRPGAGLAQFYRLWDYLQSPVLSVFTTKHAGS